MSHCPNVLIAIALFSRGYNQEVSVFAQPPQDLALRRVAFLNGTCCPCRCFSFRGSNVISGYGSATSRSFSFGFHVRAGLCTASLESARETDREFSLPPEDLVQK